MNYVLPRFKEWLYINLDSIRGKLEARIGVLGTTALFLVIVVAILLLANKLGLLGNINLV